MALSIEEIEQKIESLEGRLDGIERKPSILNGLLPIVFKKILQLSNSLQTQRIKFKIVKGHDADSPKGCFHYWGCGIDIECADYARLRQIAGPLGFTWDDKICKHPGHLELREGLKIEDFRTYRVNGDLKLIEKII